MSSESPIKTCLTLARDRMTLYGSILATIKEKLITPLKDQLSVEEVESLKTTKLLQELLRVETVSLTLKNAIRDYVDLNDYNRPIAPVFHELQQYLAIYFRYIKKYDKNYQKMKVERVEKSLIQTSMIALESQIGMPAECALYTPVQVVMLIQPILQTVLDNTTNTADRSSISSLNELCKTEISRMAVLFNVIPQNDNLIKLANSIDGFDVFQLGRRLFASVTGKKFSRKTLDPRSLHILSDGLLITQGNKFKRFIPLGEYEIKDVVDQPPFVNSVDMLNKSKSFRVNLDSTSMKINALRGFDDARSLFKQKWDSHPFFAPVWIPDEMVENCMLCQSKFTFLNRRHHCRKCGKCICTSCGKHKIAIEADDGKPKLVCDKCYEESGATSPQ